MLVNAELQYSTINRDSVKHNFRSIKSLLCQNHFQNKWSSMESYLVFFWGVGVCGSLRGNRAHKDRLTQGITHTGTYAVSVGLG